MNLNGWQRLWIVSSITWLAIAILFGMNEPMNKIHWPSYLIAFWATPVAMVYLLGSGIAWIRRGF